MNRDPGASLLSGRFGTKKLAHTRVAEQRWVGADGTHFALREVRACDRTALQRFFAELSDLARYQRFFSGQPGIPDPLLDVFTAPPVASHIGLVVTADERIVADARLVMGESGEAEIAAVVADHWQGRGIGRRLFRTLIAAARARGWATVRADFFSTNRRIIALLRDAGFTLERVAGSAVFGSATLRT